MRCHYSEHNRDCTYKRLPFMKTTRDGYLKAAHMCNTGVLLTKNEVNIVA